MDKRAQVQHNFTYHPPKPEKKHECDALRGQAAHFAQMILDFTPESREQSLALTKLEEVVMWANAAIVRQP